MRVRQVPWPLAWAVLQLGWRPGWFLESPGRPWTPFRLSPAQLTVPEGAHAAFTCSLSSWSEDLVLNWYRLSPGRQNDKLAAFYKGRSEPGPDPRFRVTRLPSGQDFRMSIVPTRRNDSGIYLCGVIFLPPNTHIQESPSAELRVTEKVLESPTTQPSAPPRPASQFPGLVVGVTSVLVGIPGLLLLAWVLATVCSRARLEAGGARSKQQPLEDAVGVPVFTVDYEELDFQGREKTPEPAPCIHTEYATIVFAGGLGSSSPARRASADSPRGPRPPRHEDGHCSWLL